MNYTDEELELLVKYAAREQRYACVEMLQATRTTRECETSKVQNTPCPDPKKVIAAWRADLPEKSYTLPAQPRLLGEMSYGVNVVVFGLNPEKPEDGRALRRVFGISRRTEDMLDVQCIDGEALVLPKNTPCYPTKKVGDAA